MVHSRFIPVVGIVGGIGSGKSSVARSLAARCPVVILDGDGIGHELLNNRKIQEQICQRFGTSIFESNGSISRHQLGRLVFGGSEQQQQNRRDLEAILHPEIRREFRKAIESARRSGRVDVVVVDAAVLLEARWQNLCDAVVFIDASRETRLQRVIVNRGWTEEEFDRREASQLSVKDKQRAADHVIDNSNDVDAAAVQLQNIIQALQSHQQHLQ